LNLSNITILITSFLRPGYLADCLDGIKKNLPECSVIVVDDGAMVADGIISMPFDSGLSAKRNLGVAATKTPFLLMGSDDFDFSTKEARDGIERMLSVLKDDPSLAVAGGNVDGNRYEGNLTVAPGQYIAQSSIPPDPSGITLVDLVVNYFIARVDSIRPYPWDERMKIGGEHGDWFLTLKDNGLKVVAVTGVNITTQKYDPDKEDPHYASYRGRAKGLGHKIFLRKRGVSEFYGAESVPPKPLHLPKFLVAVVACHKNVAKVEEQRKTWMKSMYKLDYKVFYGTGADREPEADEVFLDVNDDYVSLPAKMKAIYKWALDNGYEYICKVDDDVFVEVPRLVTAGWQNFAYSGRMNGAGSPVWASGACYWLNAHAMKLLVDAPLGSDTAEDRHAAAVLFKHGINVHNDERYSLIIYFQPDWHTAVTACICNPNVTMEMIAKGFDKGSCPEMNGAVPASPQIMRHPHVQNDEVQYFVPPPVENWEEGFMENKVQALFQRFRFVAETIPNSSHYKSLCKIYPEHIEERVETPLGPRLIFVVEHEKVG
jgi:glycosyltransferase involved in cell wall biosynthesis